MGGANNAYVNRFLRRAAYGADFFFLNRTQQFHLHG